MKKEIDVLKNMLENVNDSYFEFVDGIIFDCNHYEDKNPNIAKQLIEYMNCHPELSSSDILDYEGILIGLPYRNDDDGLWRRWNTVITEEQARQIAQNEYCED
jgi:hypothetical protein